MERTGDPAAVLELRDRPDPVPGPGELLIDVEFAGLSFADLLLIRGEYQVALPVPCVPGSELVGRVRAAGPGTTLQPGSRVMGLGRPPDGAYAELAVGIENQCEEIPADLPGPGAVALIGNYVTAHLALHRRARVQPGEIVVVHGGAGGVGTAAIQVAKAAGATVVAADLGEERAQTCRAAGADIAVDATEVRRLSDAVAQLSNGRGADVVIDTVGGDLFEAARRFIAHQGRIVIVGFTSGVIPQLKVNQVLLRNFAVMGVNSLIVLQQYPSLHHEARVAVIDLLTQEAVDPAIAALYPLEELLDATTALSQQKIHGKAVLQVS
jgi:NADPH2:quinone reductase